jgi:Uma2 family endonuclease
MSAAVASEPLKARYSADDLLKMPDGDLYELVDGELVEQKMGAQAAFLAGKLYASLDAYVVKNKLGWALADGVTYQCFPNPKTVRRPDTSFIQRGRLPNEAIPTGHIRIAPDLAAEVISPFDVVTDVDEKVEEYFSVSVPVVWVIHPQLRFIRVHRIDGNDDILRRHATLKGDGVLSGFELKLEDFFGSLDPQ